MRFTGCSFALRLAKPLLQYNGSAAPDKRIRRFGPVLSGRTWDLDDGRASPVRQAFRACQRSWPYDLAQLVPLARPAGCAPRAHPRRRPPELVSAARPASRGRYFAYALSAAQPKIVYINTRNHHQKSMISPFPMPNVSVWPPVMGRYPRS